MVQAPLRHVAMSSFHEAGYNLYGRQFLSSFSSNWPNDVGLLVYAEDVQVKADDPRIRVLDQRETLPNLLAFKERYKDDPFANGMEPHPKGRRDYRWEAVRFSNKVFAVADAIRRTVGKADQLIWLDADIVTRRAIPPSFLDQLAPRGDELTAYLNRNRCPECGWVGYNLRHPLILAFADSFEGVYTSGHFKTWGESHDSYIFWKLVQRFEAEHGAKWKGLGDEGRGGHIFLNSVLSRYMDHLKGDRKERGRSSLMELLTAYFHRLWPIRSE